MISDKFLAITPQTQSKLLQIFIKSIHPIYIKEKNKVNYVRTVVKKET